MDVPNITCVGDATMFTPTITTPNIDPAHGHSKKTRGGQPLSRQDAQHEALLDNTRKWVSGAFFGTLLKQMHESPFKSDLWDGGRGGQAFSTMYDQKLTERMSHGVGQKLVRSIVRK